MAGASAARSGAVAHQGAGDLLSNALARRAARDADVVVATYDELVGFDLEDLAGKTVISSAISDERLADLGARGVDMVLDVVPQPFAVTVSAAVLEAMMQALVGGQPSDPRRPARHHRGRGHAAADALPQRVPAQEPLRLRHPPAVAEVLRERGAARHDHQGRAGRGQRRIEKALAYAPPFTYSHVTGIRSPTGAEAEGWLITVGGTPQELMAHSPEFTYARLLRAADIARKLGAQVMGLGAFTKVVGDAA